MPGLEETIPSHQLEQTQTGSLISACKVNVFQRTSPSLIWRVIVPAKEGAGGWRERPPNLDQAPGGRARGGELKR